MPTLQEQINDAWKAAMKSGETQRRDTLSGLRAAIKRAEIDSRGTSQEFTGDDTAVQGVIEREAKKRRDAIEEYEKVGRADRAATEQEELAILQEFLPAPFTAEELEALVRAVIAETGATQPKDMGIVMKSLQPRLAGRADGKTASTLVKQLLA